jgi:CRISPR-associated protein Csd2
MNNEEPIENRYDFLILFDVKDGNPNGDPDAGNLPRLDAETGNGLITDVSIKRKIRNFVQVKKNNEPPFRIFIQEKAILNNTIKESFKAIGLNVDDQKDLKDKINQQDRDLAKKFLCQNFYDIRTFGAVLSVGLNAGQVRGPVQFTFARSVDPIVSLEHSITRIAVTTEKESLEQKGENRTMGRKFTVPYGLYRAYGFVSAPLAKQTGFSATDLELLWDSLENMFDLDRSASRGMMSTRKLVIFKHSTKLGDLSAQSLFDSVSVKKLNQEKPARDFTDYTVSINRAMIPDSITIIERV